MSFKRTSSQILDKPINSTPSGSSLILRFLGTSFSSFTLEESLNLSYQSGGNNSKIMNISLETLATSLAPGNVSSETEMPNETDALVDSGENSVFLFDRWEIQTLLILLYVVVFITGFVGNLLVLVVMWLHPRMRSTTNFFLTNLAVADFCVTIFCVLQNLSLYLAQSWIFGDFFCKMYNFINALSYTSSVMILVVNCIERYIAIMSPFRAKTILRHRNLMIVLLVVWISSGIYCFPRLLYFRVVSHVLTGAKNEIICLADRAMFDSQIFDTISFILMYLIPLTVISVLYLRIARFLWVNNVQKENAIRRHTFRSVTSSLNNTSQSFASIRVHKESTEFDSVRDVPEEYNSCVYQNDERKTYSCTGNSLQLRCHRGTFRSSCNGKSLSKIENQDHYHSKDVIQKWQRVVKLLVAVVTCFALCNLPYHLRKMLIYYYPGYKLTTNAALMATPLTQVLTYLNSALNPIVNCFMSDSFRFYIREVLTCKFTWRGKRRIAKSYFSSRPQSHQMSLKSFGKTRDRNEIYSTSKTERF